GTAKVLKNDGRFRNARITPGDSQKRRSTGKRFGAFGIWFTGFRFSGLGADGPRIAPGGGSADSVRAWQWRPRRALDHHAVAHGIERRAARTNGGDQFHRSPG